MGKRIYSVEIKSDDKEFFRRLQFFLMFPEVFEVKKKYRSDYEDFIL